MIAYFNIYYAKTFRLLIYASSVLAIKFISEP